MDKSTIYSDVSLLHPKMAGPAIDLLEYLTISYETGVTKTCFKIFETFRSPVRQAYLITKGTTKAGPWQSAHQCGLAVDFVPWVNGDEAIALGIRPGWNWDTSHDYRFLATAAKRFNLARPLEWDLVHIEHPNWPSVRASMMK